MPAFVHPAMLWGLGLIALPILIHLINLWRHRRVEWAAMEFLLESQKKNQRWVILRQLLLLAMRVAAIIAIVMVIAQPLLRNQWGAMVGAARTHHVVLLDDSFSMSDRWADTNAFARATEAIERIAQRAGNSGPGQRFSLLRFSQAARAGEADVLDYRAATVNTAFVEQVAAELSKLRPSESDIGPQAAIEAAGQLLRDNQGENLVVYLVSDFRAREWQQPDPLREALAAWNAQGAQLHFIQCVDRQHSNLAITRLQPQRGMLAAGVPLFMEVTVQNFSAETARNVSVSLRENDQVRPAVVIDEIEPGRTATRRFLVNFPTAGEHMVTATLENDAIAVDNQRLAVVDLPVGIPVLIVDGAAEANDARFLATALAPGGSTRTGIDVRIETPRYLVNRPLSQFKTIYLTNVANLDASAVRALEQYVRDGGGLGIFVGEASDSRLLNNEFYRDGQGMLPLPLTAPTHLFVDQMGSVPDLEVADHPIFSVFQGERNSFLAAVKVEKYFSALKNAEQNLPSGSRIIARLRNGAPVVVERRFGQGRVVTVLTSAAPVWNNWGRNPSFVVAMLEMQSYLTSRDEVPPPHTVGTPLVIELPAAGYQPRVEFIPPGEEQSPVVIQAEQSGDRLRAELTDVSRSGLYQVRTLTREGRTDTQRYAVSVVPEEGNLAMVDNQELAAALPGLRYEYHQATDLGWEVRDLAGFNLSDSFFYLLVMLLIGEQMLAYRNSYHPTRGGRA